MSVLGLPFWLVDAFANGPFTGNPAGVVILDELLPDEVLQKIAMEVNQAETAFLLEVENGWSLRWFTPTVEVNLCGHATLAAAWVLHKKTGGSEFDFDTRSGRLSCCISGEDLRLDFPAWPVHAHSIPSIELALFPAKNNGTAATQSDSNGILGTYVAGDDWMVELENEALVRCLDPDMMAISSLGRRGLVVTARSEKGEFDFVSRFFGPQSGVPEDPVTGSAHCALGPFWAKKLGKQTLKGFQASRRGGEVCVIPKGDRVHLLGRAFISIEGQLTLKRGS
jgi:PhzF family phenazine biosynthesis protein